MKSYNIQAIDPDTLEIKAVPKKRSDSNFLLTINCNISNYAFAQWDRDKKMNLIKTLKKISGELRNSGSYIKSDNIAKLDDISSNIEVGEKNKFIHLHIILKFDGYCHLDTKMIKQMCDMYLCPGFSKGCYVNVKFIQDTLQVASNYADKQGFKLM